MIYQWKPEARIKIDAQAAGAEMERLRVIHNGRLEAAMLVDAARNEENPLHDHFEWDDTKAAEAHRSEQARYLIRSIVVQVDSQISAEPVRAFVSVKRDEDRSFTSFAHALSDAELRAQVLADAMRELVAWRKRHAELTELANIFALVDQAQEA